MLEIRLEIDPQKLAPAQIKKFACLLLAYVDGDFDPDKQEMHGPVSLTLDPSLEAAETAFGKLSDIGPSVQIGEVVVPAPPAPAAPAPTLGGARLDKAGVPWDGRIHASSKATNADGTWRLKRGVDKNQVDSVTAELQKLMAIPSPGPQLVLPPPPPPPPPPAVAAAVVPEADAQEKFIALINRASSAMAQGKVSSEQIIKLMNSIAVPNLPALGNRLDLLPQAAALIDGLIAGQSA